MQWLICPSNMVKYCLEMQTHKETSIRIAKDYV